jgi:predicted site-specific integrase-resolvase
MKLSVWAKQQGVSYKTAWRLWRAGKLPVPAEQLETGTVVVHAEPQRTGGVALYARVSSSEQKDDLARQMERLRAHASRHGFEVVDEVGEVGSGLNGQRRGLLRLLHRSEVGVILVEHRERLARFGFDYIEASLAAQGRRIEVVEEGEMTDDVVRDLHDVIVSMCARLYGKRSAKNRADRAMKALDG